MTAVVDPHILENLSMIGGSPELAWFFLLIIALYIAARFKLGLFVGAAIALVLVLYAPAIFPIPVQMIAYISSGLILGLAFLMLMG